jgi:hypothetical protein
MTVPLLFQKSIFAAKVEATPGTAETLTNAEAAFNVDNFVLDPDLSFQQRPGQGGIGRRSAIVEGHRGVARFRTELSYDGTTIPSWASVLLPACGYINNGSGVFNPLFEPPGASVKTLTIAKYEDGNRRLLSGCSGTFTINLPTGKLGFIDWEFTGIWRGESAVSLLTPTYPTAPALRVAQGNSSFDTVDFCARTVTIAIGNTVTGLECNDDPANDTGFHYFLITDRLSTATSDPQSVLMGVQNRAAMMIAGTEGVFTTSVGGPSDSAIIFTAPKAQIMSKTGGNRDNIAIDNASYQFNRNGNAQNQEFSITFDAQS